MPGVRVAPARGEPLIADKLQRPKRIPTREALAAGDLDSGKSAATLAERVYRHIRSDIVTGALTSGERLRLDYVRARYGVGLSPIREALARLATDTFVTSIENRGYRVAELSKTDLDDITEARVTIERDALRRSIEAGDEQWEVDIVAAHYRLAKVDGRLRDALPETIGELETANRAFHAALVAACESQWLHRFRRLLQDQSRRYRHVSLLESASYREVQREHDALKEATLSRALPKALDLVEAHIRTTAALIRDKIPPGTDLDV
jgi:GntR family carbon starvation induced transcriptional regulator